MAQSGHIQSIYKSRKNILEHLKYQGYNVDDYDDFSINEVYTMYQNKQLDMFVERKENETLSIKKKKAYIKYHLAKTLRPNNIIEYIEDLFNLEQALTKDDDLIIVVREEPNETTIKTLKQLWASDKYFVVVWNIKHLQFNVLQHQLVPKHTVLSAEQTKQICEKFNIMNNSQFPDITRFSSVAMAIGIRPGEICEILRPSKTAIYSKFYRICSE
jgi:DNA-directed RNA polymerase subunit H (RpoH/RPB5)